MQLCTSDLLQYPLDLIYNLQRWKFLSSDCVVCDISVLYRLQAHVVGDLSHKFGVARSVCQMKHLVRDFFFLCHIISFFHTSHFHVVCQLVS